MGGDGGVVATDRRYMRCAGYACHTADSKRATKAELAEAEKEAQIQTMSTCAITGTTLDLKGGKVVACPLGRLYNREAAVEALMRRIESNGSGGVKDESADLGWQVRGRKDLHIVRFNLLKKKVDNEEVDVPTCPLTSVELNGIQPAFLIVKTKKNKQKEKDGDDGDTPNVLSEKGIKEMGIETLQDEYGPFKEDDIIRLAPPSKMLDEIQEKIRQRRAAEKTSKPLKKRRKKEGKNGTVKKIRSDAASSLNDATSKKSKEGPIHKKPRNINDIRNNVAAAVASNTVLSGLFADNQSKMSDKEKKNSLFASNC